MAEEEMKKRIVSVGSYMPVIMELVEEGNVVPFLITGNSMSPFLVHTRDTILLKKPDFPLKRGDMAFFIRMNGQFVMHRIWKVKDGSYYFLGDNQTEIEGPVDQRQIFAVVCGVKRKGKHLEPGSFWWDFFEKIWLPLRPVRPFLRKCYGLYYRLAGRGRKRDV